ncbi:MAG: DNA alkylation repair protein [Ignavibacteria bacterium]|jgi:3-methyladenine DNA glycosylase AlkD|nr:DNA alkylation repair protein [Ignavibacteria bacterium]
MNYIEIKKELKKLASPEKAIGYERYFKAYENIHFLGVPVPLQRQIIKTIPKLELEEISKLLKDKWHECNLIALLMLVKMMKKSKEEKEREKYFNFYCDNFQYINSWDLVDSSAPGIIGEYLLKKQDRSILKEFAKSNNIWIQRSAIVSTLTFIRNNEIDDTFEIAKLLLDKEHDLIHKAVGWLLREAGKKNFEAEYNFLVENNRYKTMPRTMLRYAIEKFPEDLRQDFLKNKI